MSSPIVTPNTDYPLPDRRKRPRRHRALESRRLQSSADGAQADNHCRNPCSLKSCFRDITLELEKNCIELILLCLMDLRVNKRLAS